MTCNAFRLQHPMAAFVSFEWYLLIDCLLSRIPHDLHMRWTPNRSLMTIEQFACWIMFFTRRKKFRRGIRFWLCFTRLKTSKWLNLIWESEYISKVVHSQVYVPSNHGIVLMVILKISHTLSIPIKVPLILILCHLVTNQKCVDKRCHLDFWDSFSSGLNWAGVNSVKQAIRSISHSLSIILLWIGYCYQTFKYLCVFFVDGKYSSSLFIEFYAWFSLFIGVVVSTDKYHGDCNVSWSTFFGDIRRKLSIKIGAYDIGRAGKFFENLRYFFRFISC